METRTVGNTRIIEDGGHALLLDTETDVVSIGCRHGAITAERAEVEALIAAWTEQTADARPLASAQLAITFQRELPSLSDEEAVSLSAFFIVNAPLLLTWQGGPQSLSHIQPPPREEHDSLRIDGLPTD